MKSYSFLGKSPRLAKNVTIESNKELRLEGTKSVSIVLVGRSRPIIHGIAPSEICSRCGQAKPFTIEHFAKDGDRLRKQCKPCRAAFKRNRRQNYETPQRREHRLAVARKYQRDNAQQIRETQKRWKNINAEHMDQYWRDYYRSNEQKIKQRATNWRLDNLDRKRKSNRAWAAANPDKQRLSSQQSKRRRRNASPQLRLFESISTQIRGSLLGGKASRSWEQLVGYTREQLVVHIERQFVDGMSWTSYGAWHIDHIIAASAFVYDSADHQEFKACWALSNLRPLWALDNIIKRDKRLFLL